MVKYKYDAWGKCQTTVVDSNANDIATLNPFRYRSYYFDTETGFYFLKTRYYDPEIGRFMTIDDISYLDPDSINGLNLYAYCGNNPVMGYDPNGTFAITTAIIIGLIAGSVFPGLGNVIGAASGALVGFGAYMLTGVVTINGKTGSEWIKEGAAVVADGLVDAGQWGADTAVDVWNEATEIVEDASEWIADTASDVWDTTTDFVEDAGEWIADTASDAWEATTDFFEDAVDAVGNFFSGIFSW